MPASYATVMGLRVLLLSTLISCAVEHEPVDTEPVLPPDMDVTTPAVPDIRCAGTPDAGPATGWRHISSRLVTMGDPHHRGTDLIATTADLTQEISGRVTYGDLDKDLEDEDLQLFACIDHVWQPLGDVRTDEDGRFTLILTGDERLALGLRDLYLSVAGDRTGVSFLAFVAPPDAPIVVSDVDGTLTASENAYPKALAIGGDTAVQPGAAEALKSAISQGVNVVYITSRGDRFTQDTRDWFAAKGFPRGPVRMPRSLITLPGTDTIEFKSDALASLGGLAILAGFGNRATDIDAYRNAGLSADRILIKLPEFTEEIAGELMAGAATGFELYDLVRTDKLPALMR